MNGFGEEEGGVYGMSTDRMKELHSTISKLYAAKPSASVFYNLK